MGNSSAQVRPVHVCACVCGGWRVVTLRREEWGAQELCVNTTQPRELLETSFGARGLGADLSNLVSRDRRYGMGRDARTFRRSFEVHWCVESKAKSRAAGVAFLPLLWVRLHSSSLLLGGACRLPLILGFWVGLLSPSFSAYPDPEKEY